MNVFFTSDTHFCHDRGFVYEPRGFKNIEEMNEAIAKRKKAQAKEKKAKEKAKEKTTSTKTETVC